MGTFWSSLLPGYASELYTCVSMSDIWCSFIAFVDYDVYFDENIGDKQQRKLYFLQNAHSDRC